MAEGRRTSRGRIASGVAAVAVAATALVAAGGARATFPGGNGLVAYVRSGDVFVINPSTGVPTQVTNTGNYDAVAYNAPANQLVASTCCSGLVLLSPVAGSAATLVPNTFATDHNPAFDPTGTKLVFDADTGSSNPETAAAAAIGADIVTIGTNGAGRTVIHSGGGRPDWSADGTFIAFHEGFGTAIKRVAPSGGSVVTLATTGPDGVTPCSSFFTPCTDVTISPDNTDVLYGQDASEQQCSECCTECALGADFHEQSGGAGGLAEVNADGTSATPRRITVQGTEGPHSTPSYSPDGTKAAFNSGENGLSTVGTGGSGVITSIGSVGVVDDTSWGIAPGTGTGTGAGTGTGGTTYSIAGPSGKVKDGPCVFTIAASAPTTGSVGFTTSVVSGRNAPDPSIGTVTFANASSASLSIDVRHSKRKHGDVSVTLTSATGGTIGSPSGAICDVGRKKQ